MSDVTELKSKVASDAKAAEQAVQKAAKDVQAAQGKAESFIEKHPLLVAYGILALAFALVVVGCNYLHK